MGCCILTFYFDLMNEVLITPCTYANILELQQIAIQAYNDHYLYLWNDEGAWYLERSFSDEALAQELKDENAVFFLIHYKKALVGFLKLNIDKALDNYPEQECLELERIYLIYAASGKGVGSEVVEFTVQFAKERNKKVVWLKAMDSSRSVNFYEKNGFRKCGTFMLDFPQMKEEYRGMYVMSRAL